MTKEEAQEYAKSMTYTDAVVNAMRGMAIPFRKATMIKLWELAKIAEKLDKKYEAKAITRGNCMICGKELTEGLFFCKECEDNRPKEVANILFP